MRADTEQELLRVVRDWDEAMVQNDANAIGRYMAVDWTIVGPDGGSMQSNVFIRQGAQWKCVLMHLSRLA